MKETLSDKSRIIENYKMREHYKILRKRMLDLQLIRRKSNAELQYLIITLKEMREKLKK